MLLRRMTVSGGAARARSRLYLGRLLVRVRILRKVRVRNHLWLRSRCSLALLLPVLARDIADRLPIRGQVHQQLDCANLLVWGRAPSRACPERSRRVQAERKLGSCE